MLNSKIWPTTTLAMRGAGFFTLGPSRSFYLRRLYSFARTLRKILRDRASLKGRVVKLSELENDFPAIGRALARRHIAEVDFVLNDISLFPRETHVKRLLGKAIRIAVRELATFGSPSRARTFRLISSLDDNNQRAACTLILSSSQSGPARVEIELASILR